MRKYVAGLLGLLLTACSGTMPDLGVKNGTLMPCPKTPNCVNSQAADKKHYIEPLHFDGTPKEAQDLLLQVIDSEKRATILKVKDNYIRTEFRSAVFRFVDDVEFYFPETKAGETIIHVRSASRIGYFDFGANRKRIEQLRSTLKSDSK